LTVQIPLNFTIAQKISQNPKYHSEPFAALKGKHREESLILANETLRFAQGDSFEIIA